jgi:copper chaperone NosL
MKILFDRANKFLSLPLEIGPRGLLLVAALLLLPTYFLPLWKLTMFAPQYPEGLRLAIYSYKLEGGNAGQDVKEINLLNHYIGMKDLTAEDFTEFKWIPFVVGVLAVLILRGAVVGTLGGLLDLLVLFLYFGAFSLWSFGYKLYRYGHDLAPTAAVKVPPFMPPLYGRKQLANFEVYSYPGAGSYLLAAVAAVLALALFVAWRRGRAEIKSEERMVG